MEKTLQHAFLCLLVLVVLIGVFISIRDLKVSIIQKLEPCLKDPFLSSIPHVWESLENTQFEEPDIPDGRNLTVVTAFVEIGMFHKVDKMHLRSKETYLDWMRAFRYIKNPVVFYTNSKAMEIAFRTIRKHNIAKTKTIIISTDELWPFQVIEKIKTLFTSPNYPKHVPNTVVPAYACVTHSKFPILADVVTRQYYNTKYYAWYDIGFFRSIMKRKKKCWIEAPNDFDQSKIAVSRAYNAQLKDVSVKAIIGGNKNWIAGCLFLGVPVTILKFHHQYKESILRYLDQGVMGAEQQMIYAMYTDEERQKYPLSIDLQTYIPGRKDTIVRDEWHYLGYLMYHEVQREK